METYILKNVRSTLKMSYTRCPSPSLTMSAQFTLKMCVAAGNRKNSLKTLF